VKEKLFPGGEDELTPTVNALQHLVLKLHLRLAPFASFQGPLALERCGGANRNRLSISPSNYPMDSAHHAPVGTWL
jgi:hypothetical protein